ncbi:MAG: ATP-grasp domain-containing protein [Candidatus Riflebacteria bacterium]|nr:ATP-grasp domain-containing protein [Candidatus Riflebacteria bacterium]
MKLALVYNQKKSAPAATEGPSEPQADDKYAEWDTPETIQAVATALATRHRVSLVEADEAAFERLRKDRPDLVFNMAEGLHGASREAQIPALLEMLDIPYTGSDPLTLAICLDKSRTKEVLAYHKVPTPAFQVVESTDEPIRVKLPCLVKPLFEGSSKGIFDDSLARDRTSLRSAVRRVLERYHQPALVERYLSGREFTVAMLGNGERQRILPIVEICFDSLPSHVNPIYSFEAKWIWDTTEQPLEIFRCPAQLDDALEERIHEVCRRTWRVLRCRDWCRIDLRLDEKGEPHVLELNPLPGILPNPADNSCFPKAARTAGISYDQLLLSVVDAAAERLGLDFV